MNTTTAQYLIQVKTDEEHDVILQDNAHQTKDIEGHQNHRAISYASG